MKDVTPKDIARTLYEALNTTALDQLRTAEKRLASGDSSGDEKKRIDAALPKDAMPQVRNFLVTMANEQALDKLASVVEAFEDLMQTGPEAVNAEVVSAVSLGKRQRDRITKELQRNYDVQPEHLNFRVDDTLIGGLIIRIGDRVFDNSLRTRLGVVQRSMMSS